MRMNKKKEIVPKLRFPEFGTSEGWKKYKLRELADRITQKVGDNKLVTLSISASIGFVSQAEKFSRDISGKQYCNYIYLKKGEFSYNKGNSKTFPQGCIYELKEYEEAAVPNAFISFRFKKNLVPSFYQGYFDSNFHGKQLIRFITSGARSDGLLNISPTDFFSIVLPTPVKKEEQQKIADCLSSIDELIDAESRKLKALEKYKKGLMQKLFPTEGKTMPEWRFPEFQDCEEWETVKLEKLALYRRGSFPQPYGLPEWYDEKSGMPFIQVFDVDDNMKLKSNTKNKISELAAQQSVFIPKGTLIITIQGSIGRVAITQYDAYIDRTLLLFEKFFRKIDKTFLAYNLQLLFDIEKQKAPGGIIKTITKQALSEFLTSIPRIEEQEKIAGCLSEVDIMITEQSNKVEQLKAHKKGLMQGLFPSLEEADV